MSTVFRSNKSVTTPVQYSTLTLSLRWNVDFVGKLASDAAILALRLQLKETGGVMVSFVSQKRHIEWKVFARDPVSVAKRCLIDVEAFSSRLWQLMPEMEKYHGPARPEALRSLTVIQRTSKEVGMKAVDVFISHAGPDKLTIANPLFDKLRGEGFSCFLDKKSMKAGDCASEEMIPAMESVKIGVFILSPEFAARRWPMKELRCFLRRRRDARSSGAAPPILIPVFYRLGVSECRSFKPEQYMDENGSNLLEAEKFYTKERQKEATAWVFPLQVQPQTAKEGGCSTVPKGSVELRFPKWDLRKDSPAYSKAFSQICSASLGTSELRQTIPKRQCKGSAISLETQRFVLAIAPTHHEL
ncbi:TIR domain-containing protein [Chondrus crispus]|uniref:ADP-ribosyl cyclase/cyclic ADP-ribose hydrolase n=1 Tax=Chondrus crispus TaxID=2769 RepID=R7QCU2_CHOCR|nr:TIR domain-containing protein [Chondrus crispus]CDF36327.1 TIR domain-containing protein [Chondrus crispus]|eukprot:XP_005716146.1 TIR domain-containing protein [Chondrus crispus]